MFAELTSRMVTLLRGGAGRRVGQTGPRPTERLVLYEFEGCPFCRRVREAVQAILEAPIKGDCVGWRVLLFNDNFNRRKNVEKALSGAGLNEQDARNDRAREQRARLKLPHCPHR